MDYEKKYKEALERARANYKADKEMGLLENCDMLELIFPELAESENERIRKALVIMIKVPRKEIFEAQGITKEQALAYLEKPKEPIDPFDTKLFQDGVKEGRRLEKEDIIRKEQKPEENGGKELLYVCNKSYKIGYRDGKRDAEQKPAEWSEEDEKMRNALWNLLKIYYAQDHSMTCVGIEAGKFRDWLKSRLPSDEEIKKAYTKGFNDAAFGGKAWKPSDEQMGALNYAYCELFKREDVDNNILGSLQNLIDTLRKL